MVSESIKKEKRHALSLSNNEDKQIVDDFINYCKSKGLRWSTEIARLIREEMEVKKMRGEL